jgi:hypothetical protein
MSGFLEMKSSKKVKLGCLPGKMTCFKKKVTGLKERENGFEKKKYSTNSSNKANKHE